MENRINKLLVLKDDRKFLILNQAIYQEKNYFLAVAVSEDGNDLSEYYKILEEVEENGVKYVRTVKDQGMIELLAKYLQPKL